MGLKKPHRQNRELGNIWMLLDGLQVGKARGVGVGDWGGEMGKGFCPNFLLIGRTIQGAISTISSPELDPPYPFSPLVICRSFFTAH